MPFDPNKPYSIEGASGGFDPSAPFEPIPQGPPLSVGARQAAMLASTPESPDPRLAPSTANVTYGPGAAETGQQITAGQEEYARTFAPDPRFPVGSRWNPPFETATSGAPRRQDAPFYVSQTGELVAQGDGESALQTLGALAGRATLGAGGIPEPIRSALLPSTRLEAAESGITSGLMGGLKNEAMGAAAGLGAKLRGEEYGPAYEETLSEMDERDRYLRTAYPLSYYGAGGAGTVAGAALTPEIRAGGAGVQALSRMLPGQAAVNAPRIARAGQVALDTGIGAGSAWGSADPGQRDTAALVGAGLAAPLSVLTRGMARTAPRTTEAPMPEVYSAAKPSELSRAARYVSRQLGRTTPEELAARIQNEEMMAAEVIGPRAQTALGALARREGETAAELQGRVSARAIDRPQRIMNTFAETTGVTSEAAAGDIEALIAAKQAEVKPLFDAARANPNPIMTDRLRAISETSAGKKALRLAADDILNDVDAPAPTAFGIEVVGATESGLPETVKVTAPTMETWDRVYKALGRAVDRDQFGRVLPDSVSPANHNINQVRRALRTELEKASPEWGQAMAQSADYMSAKSAFDRAQKMLFSTKTPADKFAKMVKEMSAGEVSAARAGVANAVFGLAQANRLRPGALKIPMVKAKLDAVLGEDGAEAVARMVADEDAMRAFETRYAPGAGSITSEINLAAKEMDENPWLDAAINAGVATAVAGPAGAKASIIRDVASGVKRHLEGGGGMSVGARDIAGKALMGSPQDLSAFLANAPRRGPRVTHAARIASKGAPRLAGQLAGNRR